MAVRILLVDGVGMCREGLTALLDSESDFEVVAQAGAADDAQALAKQHQPDVIVADLEVDGAGGASLVDRLTSAAPEARVVLATRCEEKETLAEALRLGALGCVSKRAPFAELHRAIRTVLTGKTYLGSEVATMLLDALAAGAQGPGTGQSAGHAPLSPREKEVLALLADGLSTKETALHMGIRPKTVDTHRRRIIRKLGIQDTAGLTKYAVRAGLSSLDG